MQGKVFEEYKDIIDLLQKEGCTLQTTLSFIDKNLSLLRENKDRFQDHYYFLYNKDVLYGVLIVEENDYYWSICHKNGEFDKLKSKQDKGDLWKEGDYIVEMMLHFAEQEKVRSVFPQIDQMSTEVKVKKMKEIGLNSKGYHFR